MPGAAARKDSHGLGRPNDVVEHFASRFGTPRPVETWHEINTDWCDVDSEYKRLWMAVYLLERAHRFDVSTSYVDSATGQTITLQFARAFHSVTDYSLLAYGSTSTAQWCSPAGVGCLGPLNIPEYSWHAPLFYSIQSTGYSEAPSPWQVILGCNLFEWRLDESSGTYVYPEATPIGRLGSMVHETWHTHAQPLAHHFVGACPAQNRGFEDMATCDHFTIHYKSDFGDGDLWQSLKTVWAPQLKPYQVHQEFFCDVADMNQPWVLDALVDDAALRSVAIQDHFVDPVPYSCGKPTPWGGVRQVTRDLDDLCSTEVCTGNAGTVTEDPCPPALPTCVAGCCEFDERLE